jgi:hypothetical protein
MEDVLVLLDILLSYLEDVKMGTTLHTQSLILVTVFHGIEMPVLIPNAPWTWARRQDTEQFSGLISGQKGAQISTVLLSWLLRGCQKTN